MSQVTLFTGAAERARALAVFSFTGAAGASIGQVLGEGPGPKAITEDDLVKLLSEQQFGVLATNKRNGRPVGAAGRSVR